LVADRLQQPAHHRVAHEIHCVADAEEVLRGAVRVQRGSVAVEDDDRVRRRLNDAEQPLEQNAAFAAEMRPSRSDKKIATGSDGSE
jgi:hypothetical protein